MSTHSFFKTGCDTCRGRIEYPADLAGHLVACPHCGHLTRLTAPQTPIVGPKPLSETTAQFLVRIRRESSYHTQRKLIGATHVILLLAAGLSFVLGLWPIFEPPVSGASGNTTLFCSVLFALGLLLMIGATIMKIGLSLLADLADTTLDLNRRTAIK